ncbi:MAG: TPM domain-containing protein [Bacteroidota bacterium]
MIRLLIFLMLIVGRISSLAQGFPEPMNPSHPVNDLAQILDQQQFILLENKLANYNDSTANEIAVAIIGSTYSYEISDYGAELAERWGVGKTKKGNGILLLVAMDDRSVSITIGFGLKTVVTDEDSKRLIENYILPNFRDGRYFDGIDQATSILMALASEEFKTDPESQQRSFGSLFLLVVGIICVFWILSRIRRNRRRSFGTRPLNTMSHILMLGGLNTQKGRSFADFSKGGGVFGGGSHGGGGTSGSW